MCYSAQLIQNHKAYLREFPGTQIDLREFVRLTEARLTGHRASITKAMEHSFITSDRPEDAEVARHLRLYSERHEQDLRAELAFQQERHFKAQTALSAKETKKAKDDLRISATKIKRIQAQLTDQERVELLPKDSRIYPMGYAPVLVMIDGEKRLLPMRYLLRPAGKPPEFDQQYSGCYNARRDNLQHFWKKQFGVTHGIVMMERFYENVARNDYEHRPLRSGEKVENAIVEFRPGDDKTMMVACLWSRWEQAGDELYSFAIITDDPPPEVRETGHDRCVIQIKREFVDTWLDCEGRSPEALMAILTDRPEVKYTHRLISDPNPAADAGRSR